MPPASQLRHFGPQVRCLALRVFFETPSESFLEGCTKEQLLKIAEHYRIEIGNKRPKDTVKSILRANLYDMDILPGKTGGVGDAAGAFLPKSQVGNLPFEQQKELLLLQMQHEKLKHQIEADKQLALERMKNGTEQARIKLEREKLSLIREGKLSLETGQSAECVSPVDGFDFVGNLKLVPRFSEKDPETFFSV